MQLLAQVAHKIFMEVLRQILESLQVDPKMFLLEQLLVLSLPLAFTYLKHRSYARIFLVKVEYGTCSYGLDRGFLVSILSLAHRRRNHSVIAAGLDDNTADIPKS